MLSCADMIARRRCRANVATPGNSLLRSTFHSRDLGIRPVFKKGAYVPNFRLHQKDIRSRRKVAEASSKGLYVLIFHESG
jgi:hypothetical protein